MSRNGHSAIEFALATIILGLALIPIFGLFRSSRKSTFKSKISYLALHVARERLEEMRQLPFYRLEAMADGEWHPTEGNVFKWTIEQRNAYPEVYVDTGSGLTVGGTAISASSAYQGLNDDAYQYPEEYSRIWTRISLEDVPRRNYGRDDLGDDTDGVQAKIKPVRMKKVTIQYYWQEKGESLDVARLRHFNTLSTIIASHNIQ